MKKAIIGLGLAAVLASLLISAWRIANSGVPKWTDEGFAVESNQSFCAVEKEEMQAEDPVIGYGVGKAVTAGRAQTIGDATRRFELFEKGWSQQIDWKDDTPAAHRARTVYPNMALLTPTPRLKVGDKLQLMLFDDLVLEAEISNVTTYSSGTVGMTARMDGDIAGVLYLTYSGNELRLSADVFGGNDYYVRFDPATKQHVAIEVDRAASDYLECKECSAIADADATGPAKALGSELEQLDAGPLDTAVIDVMVVYTPAAKAREGGLNGINNNIAMAMQKANEAHGNSDTRVTFNLMHSAETAYVESGSGSTDLDRLTFTGGANSAMDEVHDLRDDYGVDLVCLFADIEYTGGIAWLLNSSSGQPERGFSMARVKQSDWSYTVVHEWGHNMGCGHSKAQTTQPGPGLYSYSAGWQWSDSAASAPSIGFCSIMTYEDVDDDDSDEYERKPYFSNPDIDYAGNSTNPTGDTADGDNARTIRNVRNVVAAYRASIEPVDSDSDGMPNEWELQYFGNPTSAVATADSDGDGTDNLTEYIAGTLPNDIGSVFKISSYSVAPTGTPVILNWTTMPGRVYGVGYSSDLKYSDFSPISGATNLPYTQNSYTDTVYRAGAIHFYRIDVQLEQ